MIMDLLDKSAQLGARRSSPARGQDDGQLGLREAAPARSKLDEPRKLAQPDIAAKACVRSASASDDLVAGDDRVGIHAATVPRRPPPLEPRLWPGWRGKSGPLYRRDSIFLESMHAQLG